MLKPLQNNCLLQPTEEDQLSLSLDLELDNLLIAVQFGVVGKNDAHDRLRHLKSKLDKAQLKLSTLYFKKLA